MDDTCEVYGASAVKTVQPETRYARLGEDRLAYQVLGQGPPDLVLTIGSLGSIDLAWEEPGARTVPPKVGVVLSADPV
jgi:hypothetical protein